MLALEPLADEGVKGELEAACFVCDHAAQTRELHLRRWTCCQMMVSDLIMLHIADPIKACALAAPCIGTCCLKLTLTGRFDRMCTPRRCSSSASSRCVAPLWMADWVESSP